MMKKILIGIVVTIGMVALSTGAYAEGGGAGDGILYVPGEYANIAAALVNADPGDIIDIAAGTYAENLTVDKQLVIRGAGSGSTAIDASGGSHGILLEAGGSSAAQRMVIKDLTITGATFDGIRAYKAGGLNLDHVTFENLVSTLNGGKGVEIHNDVVVSDMEINNCDFVNNTGQGLRTASNVILDGMAISDSNFNQNLYGIYLQGTIGNVTILRSTFNDNIGAISSGLPNSHGAYMTETGPLNGLRIEDSEFKNNSGCGLMVWNTHDNADISITGTSFQDNNKWGVLIWGNTLTNVLIEDSSVLNNDGLGAGYYAIDFYTYGVLMTDVAVHCTDIAGHTLGGGVKNRNEAITAIVDATFNWWGDASGPGGVGSGAGDAVTAYVDFEPWLEAEVGEICPPPPIVEMSYFHVKKFELKTAKNQVKFYADFILGIESNGIDLENDDTTLVVTDPAAAETVLDLTIPAGSWACKFDKNGNLKECKAKFENNGNKIEGKLKLDKKNPSKWKFKLKGKPLAFNPPSGTVDATFTIQDDTGSEENVPVKLK